MKNALPASKVIRAKTLQGTPDTLETIIKRFGIATKAKLSNLSVMGHPESQLRAPIERLITDLSLLVVPGETLTAVGETSVSNLKTRPDYAITLSGTLVGFIEIKAPGKGSDPRSFKDPHDITQWEHLKSLPNLIYTDGNSFSLWQSGELVGGIVRLLGDVESSGANLKAPDSLQVLIERFLCWQPIAPRNPKQLAQTAARLCKLLRTDVLENLEDNNTTLRDHAQTWRNLLFPEASDSQFADGYAQTVTFGMLMARARDVGLSNLETAAKHLEPSLLGSALRILTYHADKSGLSSSIETLKRVFSAVDWSLIEKGNAETWLYFYEDFLAEYDNKLRRLTGSYYTPPDVVNEMVRFVDEVLRSRFSQPFGLASDAVTLMDPAVGTGTFLVSALRRIAKAVSSDQGPGAVSATIESVLKRLIALEVQLGPFAVAQLRILAEVTDLVGQAPMEPFRMFVTDTLSNPHVEQEWLAPILKPLGESRTQANRIKKEERIMVVIGNPPYKDKAKGKGGWVEEGDEKDNPPLEDWLPPASWNVGVHTKHLRNLYVYFWRWATWKVFDQNPKANTGVVCFISASGFLNGPGFRKMREYLRRTANEIWVIDCTPEGHQPDVSSRIFEAVQQPICIMLVSRSPKTTTTKPALVWHQTLPKGDRDVKFKALRKISLNDCGGWSSCPSEWDAPFLPAHANTWSSYVPLEDMFVYTGSGVMPGRTWVIAPDEASLHKRWKRLVSAKQTEKDFLFHPHLRNGKPGDKHARKVVSRGLPGHPPRTCCVAEDRGSCIQPIRYGFRSFDRQWVIPDNRLLNQPNPELWDAHSDKQVYLTGLIQHSSMSGPALTATGLLPDLNFYRGNSGGRVFPLWLDPGCRYSSIKPNVLVELSRRYSIEARPEDLFAYIMGLVSHSGYIKRFHSNLVRPGLRVPITANLKLFSEVVEAGKRVLWLHTFGERFEDAKAGRPSGPPRYRGSSLLIPRGGAIVGDMPNEIEYEKEKRRLHIGTGYIDGVSPEVWAYNISGVPVIKHWFSYRKKDRERPVIGDRRPPSPLGGIQPDQWLPEYTTELLNVLHVLSLLVEFEPIQEDLLRRVCSGNIIEFEEFKKVDAFSLGSYPSKPSKILRTRASDSQLPLFEEAD